MNTRDKKRDRKSGRAGWARFDTLGLVIVVLLFGAMLKYMLPRALEGRYRFPAVTMEYTMLNLRNALTSYYAEHNSYPPRYGYRQSGDDDSGYYLQPWMTHIEAHGNFDLNDLFSGYTSDTPCEYVPLLEFLPLGKIDPDTGAATFSERRYTGSLADQAGIEHAGCFEEYQPFVYIPVNREQFELAKAYWMSHHDWHAVHWDQDAPELEGMKFPPHSYDEYVLISAGPAGRYYGVVADPPSGNFDSRDLYHVTALRAYFLATRDLDQNGELDFDCRARSRSGEDTREYTVEIDGEPFDPTPTTGRCADGDCYPNSLPDTYGDPNGYGPWIQMFP